MDELILYPELPDYAGGFLHNISGGDIQKIIDNLDIDNIYEHDNNLTQTNNEINGGSKTPIDDNEEYIIDLHNNENTNENENEEYALDLYNNENNNENNNETKGGFKYESSYDILDYDEIDYENNNKNNKENNNENYNILDYDDNDDNTNDILDYENNNDILDYDNNENENTNENNDDSISTDTANLENNTDENNDDILDYDEEPKRIAGGGNVLQILVNLIPSVFPKSYL